MTRRPDGQSSHRASRGRPEEGSTKSAGKLESTRIQDFSPGRALLTPDFRLNRGSTLRSASPPPERRGLEPRTRYRPARHHGVGRTVRATARTARNLDAGKMARSSRFIGHPPPVVKRLEAGPLITRAARASDPYRPRSRRHTELLPGISASSPIAAPITTSTPASRDCCSRDSKLLIGELQGQLPPTCWGRSQSPIPIASGRSCVTPSFRSTP